MIFSSILLMSRESESVRLGRELSIVMRDEYKLDDETDHLLNAGIYQFPDVRQIKTDKRILTRMQTQFSAKVHVKQTPLYFHRHDFVEILYMYRGSCRQYIENLSNCVILQEGDLFLLNQNVIHAVTQEDEQAILIKIVLPMEMISYEFIQKMEYGNELYDFFVDAKSPQGKYYHYLHYRNCTGEAKNLIERIMTEYYLQRRCYEESVKCYLQLLMIFLERNDRLYYGSRHKLTHSSIQTGRIVQYIYDHSDNITLEELSRVFSFNQSYLSRVIKENCKMNFTELVRECRLEKAAMLLISSDHSVEEIAMLVGYHNAVPVYQGMKEKFGVSPAEYRKNYPINGS